MHLCECLERSVRLDLRFQVWHFRCFQLHLGMPILHCVERCQPSGSIHWVVIRKFHQKKEYGPVVLLVVGEGLQVFVHSLVLPLRLAVGLQLHGRWDSVVEPHVGADSCPESPGELRSAIGDDSDLYYMLADRTLTKHICQFRWSYILPAGQVFRRLGWLVVYDPNHGVSRRG